MAVERALVPPLVAVGRLTDASDALSISIGRLPE
jgi:hypothetical protein